MADSKIKLGLIPLIIKDEVAADLWGTIEKVAAIGYLGIEGGHLLEGDVKANRERLEALGMQVAAVGVKKDDLSERLDEVAERALALGSRYLVTYYNACDDLDQWKTDIAFYDGIGKRCRAHGLTFCYHNHDHEIRTIHGGKRALDVMLEESDPEHLALEMDVAWVQFGGADPIEFLRERAERTPLLHLKDLEDLEERGRFTSIGTGLVDIEGVLETAVEVGVDWAIVEQDRPNNLTPMDSVRASYLNLKEWGWV
jgi:sugar phosphate isomerase/epimerase